MTSIRRFIKSYPVDTVGILVIYSVALLLLASAVASWWVNHQSPPPAPFAYNSIEISNKPASGDSAHFVIKGVSQPGRRTTLIWAQLTCEDQPTTYYTPRVVQTNLDEERPFVTPTYRQLPTVQKDTPCTYRHGAVVLSERRDQTETAIEFTLKAKK